MAQALGSASLSAALSTVEELYDGLRNLLQELDNAAVKWQPPIVDSNSIAVLVQHTLGSVGRWLSRAAGAPAHTDRASEFRTQGSRDELLASVEQARAEAREYFRALENVDAGAIRVSRMTGAQEDIHPTVAWCVQHALVHAGEHWGQIQLTRQLYAAQRA